MKPNTLSEETLGDGPERADILLRGLVGKRLVSAEKMEYQLRLMFGSGTEFVISSPWRLCHNSCALIGSGDFKGAEPATPFSDLTDAKVVSPEVAQTWETKVFFEGGHSLEVFPDSVKYETWEAHLESGWVVFSGAQTTLFQPVPRATDDGTPGASSS